MAACFPWTDTRSEDSFLSRGGAEVGANCWRSWREGRWRGYDEPIRGVSGPGGCVKAGGEDLREFCRYCVKDEWVSGSAAARPVRVSRPGGEGRAGILNGVMHGCSMLFD